MMKSPSDHAEASMPDYANQMANNMERRPSWQGPPQMHRPLMQSADHDQAHQRQTFLAEKNDSYGVPTAYANSPALSQGSNSWQDLPQSMNQLERFQPSPANSANSQYMDSVENSTNPAVNTNGISGAAAAAAAAMAAAAHSAKGTVVYQTPPPVPAMPPTSNAVPVHAQQHRMPPPVQRGMPFPPNYANVQPSNMGPPVQDPASYQNHAYGGYNAPPRQAPMVRHMMGPGSHYPGHMPQWGPQQPNSPDMRVRYGYEGHPQHPMGERPPYHPYPSPSNPMAPVSNSMMMEMEDNKPKISTSARSSSQKISALYEPDEPGRKEFIDRVLQYWEGKELPLKHAPLMGRRTLDLFVLYQHVKKKGFMQEVTRSKEWAEISSAMGLGNTSATGFTLKKQYCKYLYGFECRYERGEQEPQDALARVIESNRKKKQLAEQQQVKTTESPPTNKPPMNTDPMQHPHPELQQQPQQQPQQSQQQPQQQQQQQHHQRHPHPPGYMPNQPMDPYSQQRARNMMGGRVIDSTGQMHPNAQIMQMQPMQYGQHGGYRPNEGPVAYSGPGHQQHPYPPPHHASYPHRPTNGYPQQVDPGHMSGMPQNIQKHTQPHPLPQRPPYGSPYYRGGPQTPQIMEAHAPESKPNIPIPQSQPQTEASPAQRGWPKNEVVPSSIPRTEVTDNTVKEKVAETEVSESPDTQNTAVEAPTSESKPDSQANTPTSTTIVKQEKDEQLLTSALPTAELETQNLTPNSELPRDKTPDITPDIAAKVEPAPPSRHSTPQPTSAGVPISTPSLANSQSQPQEKYSASPSLPPPPTHGPNQYAFSGKSEPRQQMGYPQYPVSSGQPPPFPSSSPLLLPQESMRPMMDNRPKYDPMMPRGMAPHPQHSYHPQAGPYRGMTPPMQSGQKRQMHPMELYGPPNKMPRPDIPQYHDSYERHAGPPGRPLTNELGAHMQQYPPYNPNSMHRLGPGDRSSGPYGPQQSPHHPKQLPGPRPPMMADGSGPMYPGMHPMKHQRKMNIPASESATKYLQGLYKDHPGHPNQPGHAPRQYLPAQPGSVTYLLNSPHPHHRRHHGSSSSRSLPPGCVEMTQPVFANAKGKSSQDVGTVEAWQIIMALKSGLLTESTWALNALSVMLHDQKTVGQIVLQQLPGLLDAAIEHFRCSLRELFNMRKGPKVPWTVKNKTIFPESVEKLNEDTDDDIVSTDQNKCILQPVATSTKYSKYVPAPTNLQNPFSKLPVKMSMESEDCASMREFMWEESEKKSNERLHILSCFNGNPIFEHVVDDKELVKPPISQDAENHAAEVTLEDMLSVPSFVKCHQVINFEDDALSDNLEEDTALDSEKSSSNVNVSDAKTSERDITLLKDDVTKPIIANMDSNEDKTSKGEEKASHIQSCLEHFLWRRKVVLLEDEAAGFPGNLRYPTGNVEYVFSQKLKDKESELVSRTLCLSNLIRGFSCSSNNYTDLCLHEDFIRILSGSLLLCHKHRIRRFKSQIHDNTSTVSDEASTTAPKDFENCSGCKPEGFINNESAEGAENTSNSDTAIRKCRKRTLSVKLFDCSSVNKCVSDSQQNGIDSDSMDSNADDKSCKVTNIEASKLNNSLLNGKGIHADQLNDIVINKKKQIKSSEQVISDELPNTITATQDDEKQSISDSNLYENEETKPNEEETETKCAVDDDMFKFEYSSSVLDNSVTNYDEDECYNDPWWWECVRQIREDALVILSNLSTSINLSNFANDDVVYAIVDACLHWAVCSSADAQDPFPSNSPRTTPSPQSLGIEILVKLSMKESNVDIILATRPYSRLEKLFKKLTGMVGNRKDQMLREFSIVLLSNLCDEHTASRAIALQPSAISHLLSFLEECEETGLNNQRMFPASQEIVNCGTIPYMMQKCALTLLKLAKLQDNRPLFLKHNLRLLSLSMSSLLGNIVLSLLSSVLFELNNELPNR